MDSVSSWECVAPFREVESPHSPSWALPCAGPVLVTLLFTRPMLEYYRHF